MPSARRLPRVMLLAGAVIAQMRPTVRALRRAPAFSLAVIGTVTLCVGPCAGVWLALHALVLKPLPFPEADRIVGVVNLAERTGGQRLASSTPQSVDFAQHADQFVAFGTQRRETVVLGDGSVAARVSVDLVSAGYFGVFQVAPLTGRYFTAEETLPGRDDVVVLAERFWQNRYLGDPSVIGRQITLEGRTCTIVGIAPRILDSVGPETAIYRPYAPAPSRHDPQARYRGDLNLVARLRPGIDLQAAQDQLAALERDFVGRVATPAIRTLAQDSGFRPVVLPLRPGGIAREFPEAWLLQAGTLMVLLVGGVNLFHLLVARLLAREADQAIRIALGAPALRAAAPLIVEAVLLSGLGTILGLFLACSGIRVLNLFLPALVPGAPPVTLDGDILAWTFLAVGFLGLGVTTLPLVWLSRRRGTARALHVGTSTPRMRSATGWMVTLQVAVAALLLAESSLLIRSFIHATQRDLGFDARQVVQVRVALPGRYTESAQRLDLQRRLVEAVRGLPGIDAVAVCHDPAIQANARPVPVGLRGDGPLHGEGRSPIHIVTVSPDYFQVLGIRQIQGRRFDAADAFAKAPVALVDETFARLILPAGNAEGTEIYLSRGLPLAVDAWPRIVGVVSRAEITGLDSHDDLPIVYVPMVDFAPRTFQVLMRTARPAADVLRDVHAAAALVDPEVALYGGSSLAQALDTLLLPRRGLTLLLATLAALALLLAGIGLYGLFAYEVARRSRELGIRGALGATRTQLVRLIMERGLIRTATGLLLGLTGALFLEPPIAGFLFGVTARDPLTFAVVSMLLLSVAVVACGLPALRAGHVNPADTLRAG